MWLVAIVTIAGAIAGAGVSQKPVIDSPIVGDVYDLPKTLDGLYERADAVVIARIVAANDRSQPKKARTDYEIDLVAVMKEHIRLDDNSIVCRAIGTVEYPDRIVRVFQPRLPGFERGNQYLLFLKWEEARGCFTPAFGPPGAALMDPVAGLQPFIEDHPLSALKGLTTAQVARRVAQAQKR
jgi:hypothetical protein